MKQSFDITVVRTGYATRTITVEAENQEEAEQLALDEAGDHEFSEHSSDYSIEDHNVPLTVKDLEKIYHLIDGECITETENVSMTTIRKILAKFGANPENMY